MSGLIILFLSLVHLDNIIFCSTYNYIIHVCDTIMSLPQLPVELLAVGSPVHSANALYYTAAVYNILAVRLYMYNIVGCQ